MTTREEITKEVNDDLAKNDIDLLVDVYEEILKEDRSIHENIIHSQKRLSSLLVKLSRQADKSTKKVVFLTWVIIALTVVLVMTVFFEIPKITVQFNQKPYFSTQNNQCDKNNPTNNVV